MRYGSGGASDLLAARRQDAERQVEVAKPTPPVEEKTRAVFPCAMGGWQWNNISSVGTAYEALFRNNSAGEGFPILRPGRIIGMSTHVNGGAIGGTSYEQQVYVKPAGGAATATGISTSMSGTEEHKEAEGDYPLNPGDIVYGYHKRTGALNTRDSEMFVWFEFWENVKEAS